MLPGFGCICHIFQLCIVLCLRLCLSFLTLVQFALNLVQLNLLFPELLEHRVLHALQLLNVNPVLGFLFFHLTLQLCNLLSCPLLCLQQRCSFAFGILGRSILCLQCCCCFSCCYSRCCLQCLQY